MKRAMKDRNRLTDDEQRLAAALKQEPVPDVPAERIAAACRAAAAVWGGAAYPAYPTVRPYNLCAAAFSCLTAGCAFFWIVLALLLGGCAAVFRLCAVPGVSPLALLTTIAPVPVLSFWIRELYCRDEALVQLERTCRFSPEKLCFARLWGGMACNILFTVLAGALAFPDAAHLAQTCLCAFTALFFVGALALLLISFLREALPLSLLLAAWVLAASYLMEQQELLDEIARAGMGTWTAVLAAGVGAFAATSVYLSKKRYAE